MYEKVIERLVNESRKISRTRLSEEYTERVTKTADKIKTINEPVVSSLITKEENNSNNHNEKIKKKQIPIVSNRYPTKRVSFEDGTIWL